MPFGALRGASDGLFSVSVAGTVHLTHAPPTSGLPQVARRGIHIPFVKSFVRHDGARPAWQCVLDEVCCTTTSQGISGTGICGSRLRS